jgi:3-oxoacyl-[acyl-carrier-protein] synthase I
MKKRIVVTGLGVVAPNGSDIIQFTDALKTGRSGIRRIDILEKLNFLCQIGGIPQIESSGNYSFLKDFGLEQSGEAIKYAVMASLEAWKDAGLSIPPPDSQPADDAGIILGSSVGNADLWEKAIDFTRQGKHLKLGSLHLEQIFFSSISSYVAGLLGLGNLASVSSFACASAIEAIMTGMERISSGNAKQMLVGGVDSSAYYYWAMMDSMRVTASKFNDQPEKGSRPMSASACGFVPAAGAGIIMIEDLDYALNRGARIYAELLGGALSCGGQRNEGSMTRLNSVAMHKCIHAALENSKIRTEEIDYISGHLTATKADIYEIETWADILKRKPDDFPYVNSVKSMTGHPMGASGGIETVATILQMYQNFISPSINSEDIHPEIEKYIARERVPLHPVLNYDFDIAAKSSFGFGDVYSCLIIKKFR